MAFRDPNDPYFHDPYGLALGKPDPYSGFAYDPTAQARSQQIKQERARIADTIEAEDRAVRAAKASDILNEMAPVPKQISPEEEQGLFSSAAEATLGGLAAVGNVLDLPGSMVRDVLAFENPLDQLLPWNWTTHKG